MSGTLLVFQPHSLPQVREFSQPPSLEEVQAEVGGDLQLVPGFRTIRYGAVVMDCFALCNANGKHKGLAMNDLATIAWKEALRRAIDAGLWRSGRALNAMRTAILAKNRDRSLASPAPEN
jgi:hypothetical protein